MFELISIKWENIRSFGEQSEVLHEIKFSKDANKGKRVTIITGPNGSGKTAIVETLAFALTPASTHQDGLASFINQLSEDKNCHGEVILELKDAVKNVVYKIVWELKAPRTAACTIFEDDVQRWKYTQNQAAEKLRELLRVPKGLVETLLVVAQEDAQWPFSTDKVVKDLFDRLLCLEEANSEILGIRRDITNIENDLVTEKTKFSAMEDYVKISKLEAERDALYPKIQTLCTEENNLRMSGQSKQAKLNHYRKLYESAENYNTAIASLDLDAKREEIENLNGATLTKQLKVLKKKKTALETEMGELNDDNTKIKKEIEKHSNEDNETRRKLAVAEVKARHADSSITQLKEYMATLGKEFSDNVSAEEVLNESQSFIDQEDSEMDSDVDWDNIVEPHEALKVLGNICSYTTRCEQKMKDLEDQASAKGISLADVEGLFERKLKKVLKLAVSSGIMKGKLLAYSDTLKILHKNGSIRSKILKMRSDLKKKYQKEKEELALKKNHLKTLQKFWKEFLDLNGCLSMKENISLISDPEPLAKRRRAGSEERAYNLTEPIINTASRAALRILRASCTKLPRNDDVQSRLSRTLKANEKKLASLRKNQASVKKRREDLTSAITINEEKIVLLKAKQKARQYLDDYQDLLKPDDPDFLQPDTKSTTLRPLEEQLSSVQRSLLTNIQKYTEYKLKLESFEKSIATATRMNAQRKKAEDHVNSLGKRLEGKKLELQKKVDELEGNHREKITEINEAIASAWENYPGRDLKSVIVDVNKTDITAKTIKYLYNFKMLYFSESNSDDSEDSEDEENDGPTLLMRGRGEKFFAFVVIRWALAQRLAPHLNFIVFDEPQSCLDQKTLDHLINFFQTKMSSKQVVVATVNRRIVDKLKKKAAYGQIIRLKKDENRKSYVRLQLA